MIGRRLDFGSFSAAVPPPWEDITADLANGAPFTIARGASGRGALQFSVAPYKAGKRPAIRKENLADMLADFAASNDLLATTDTISGNNEHLAWSECDYQRGADFVRAWYASNGEDVLKATYLVELDATERTIELEEAEMIIQSVRFRSQGD